MSDLQPSRFGIRLEPIPGSVGRARSALLTAGGIILIVALFAPLPKGVDGNIGIIAIIVSLMGLVCQSSKSAGAEAAKRCIALAEAERTRRVRVFADAAGELQSSTKMLEDTERVLELQQRLALRDDELSTFPLGQMRGVVEMLTFERECGGHIQSVSGHEQVVAPDTCFYIAPALLDQRGETQSQGTLYLTNARALFLSTDGLSTAEWRKVATVDRDGRTLRIQRRDRQTPYVFHMTWGDSMKAEWVAKNVLSSTVAQP